MSQNRELPVRPIGVIASLAAGLDAVIQGWWIALFPFLLDLFLWFGPHLSVMPAAERVFAQLREWLGDNPALELMLESAGELNLFSTLGVAPLGVPSLMSVKLPQGTPLGLPAVVSLDNEFAGLVLAAVFSLVGVLVGGAYLGLIAQQVRDGALDGVRLFKLLPRYWMSILVVIVALLVAAGLLSLPMLVIASLLAGISVWLATLVVWIGFMLLLWLTFHLFFTVHGLLLSEQSLLTAVWNSLRLTAFNSFSAMGLVVLAFAVSAGLDYLWSLPKDTSWMLLVGIAGHAVISSGVVAATFVFYKDRFRYWQELRSFLAQTAQESLEGNA